MGKKVGKKKGSNQTRKKKKDVQTKTTGGRHPDVICKQSEEGEVYGIVKKCSGSRRFSVLIQDPENESTRTITCGLKGSIRKFVRTDALVLVALYEFNKNQGQIIDIYTSEEVNAMRRNNCWDFDAALDEDELQSDQTIVVTFTNDVDYGIQYSSSSSGEEDEELGPPARTTTTFVNLFSI